MKSSPHGVTGDVNARSFSCSHYILLTESGSSRIIMLRVRCLAACRPLLCGRTYATVAEPHALVFLEHREGVIDSGSLSAVTAAQQLGGQVTGLIIGGPDQVQAVLPKAKK